MLYTPYDIQIEDVSAGCSCQATISDLTRELAKTSIDAKWWEDIELPPAGPDDPYQDSHWRWEQLVIEYGSRPENSCVGLSTSDGEIHAAMIYGINGDAILVEGAALLIHFIATAPKARARGARKYKGCGCGLITHAVATSFSLGFAGVVGLFALPGAESFYEREGFTRTGRTDTSGQLAHFELNPDAAKDRLRTKGIIT